EEREPHGPRGTGRPPPAAPRPPLLRARAAGGTAPAALAQPARSGAAALPSRPPRALRSLQPFPVRRRRARLRAAPGKTATTAPDPVSSGAPILPLLPRRRPGTAAPLPGPCAGGNVAPPDGGRGGPSHPDGAPLPGRGQGRPGRGDAGQAAADLVHHGGGQYVVSGFLGVEPHGDPESVQYALAAGEHLGVGRVPLGPAELGADAVAQCERLVEVGEGDGDGTGRDQAVLPQEAGEVGPVSQVAGGGGEGPH